ncbi:MAG: Mrp/NBP35 family ATP-binding protein [Desulfurococcaceae archaeon]|nr:Mrp/NBP35 family ATP-binding protein [Desulfurococcaceae archaeon]
MEGRGPSIRMPPKITDPRKQAALEKLKNVKYVVAITSGKGGVGKSFIASNLALTLKTLGYEVGLMDIDFHGPSAPKMLGIRGQRLIALSGGIQPAQGPLGLKVMSLDFLLEDDDTPVIWRGPIKTTAIFQFITDVSWGNLDFLVIDMPPGTGDEAITVAQEIPKIDGVVFVTIPSEVSVLVVGRSIMFYKRLGKRPIGVVENMSAFYCPDTGKTYKVFGKGSGRILSEKYGIPLLAEIPLDPRISEANDEGRPYVLAYPETPVTKSFEEMARKIAEILKTPEGRSEEKTG